MIEVQAAFAKYFKTERDRSEKALADIVEIVCGGNEYEVVVAKIMERLEAHYGRYGEPGSLAPLGNALADTDGVNGETAK